MDQTNVLFILAEPKGEASNCDVLSSPICIYVYVVPTPKRSGNNRTFHSTLWRFRLESWTGNHSVARNRNSLTTLWHMVYWMRPLLALVLKVLWRAYVTSAHLIVKKKGSSTVQVLLSPSYRRPLNTVCEYSTLCDLVKLHWLSAESNHCVHSYQGLKVFY